MPNFYITKKNYFLLIFPFFYTFFSRMRGLRGFAFNALTSWMPGVILSVGLSGADPIHSIVSYFCAYIAFISVYEIGYLANDTWGTRHDETPRKRIDVEYSIPFLVIFIAARLGVAGAILFAMSQGDPAWISYLYMALVSTILIHNLIRKIEFKFVSFFQMSMLRFSIPVLTVLGREEAPIVFILAAMYFVLPRFITYQVSKGRLSLPEKSSDSYLLKFYLLMLPVGILMFAATRDLTALVFSIYFIVVQMAYLSSAPVRRLLQK